MCDISIHPTAIVGSGAELGEGVTIGPYAVIADRVKIGAGTAVGPHAVIHDYAEIGTNCKIHAHAVLADLAQDLAFDGSETFVKIGNDCVIREGVTIHRGTKDGTATEVGNNCFLMAYAHLAHNVKIGHNVIMANAAILAGYCEVADNCFISGGAIVHQFCKIGWLAMVGGLSGISKDVPPFCTTLSAMRNKVAGLNVVGMRRAGISVEDRKAVKKAFALLYQSGLNTSQAVAQLKKDFPEGPASEFASFIEKSDRGICACVARSGSD